jgi:hypothetical protein
MAEIAGENRKPAARVEWMGAAAQNLLIAGLIGGIRPGERTVFRKTRLDEIAVELEDQPTAGRAAVVVDLVDHQRRSAGGRRIRPWTSSAQSIKRSAAR